MSEERVHYWGATDATWRRVQEAANTEGVPVHDWVRDAVLERLERDVPPKTTAPPVLPGQESLL